MTIEELKAALDAIQNKGEINKTRRAEIQKLLQELTREMRKK